MEILKQLISKPNVFEVLWVSFWFFSVPIATYALLRMIGGTDVVLVDRTTILLRREIFTIAVGKECLVSEMRNLRFQPETGSGRGHRDSKIAFDYGAKTITFGDQLDEAEATQLIALIKQQCNISETLPRDGSTPQFWQSH